MAIHRLADQVVQASLGAPGTSATRILFVKDKHVWSVDQDGANLHLVSSATKEALSPAWSKDGKRIAYMEFNSGDGEIYLLDLSTGMRSVVYGSTGKYSDFTPTFSPDGKTITFSRATEEGTDLWSVNYRDACCLQRLTVGRFSDNLSPTFSPDGRRLAFVSTRPGLAQIYVMGADGTDQQLFAPFDYGVSGSSNAPDWSPDGLSVAFHRDVGGTLQVFVLDVRKGTVKQLTSLGRNEDPTWAPDSRHVAFVSDRAGYRQLWIIDLETGLHPSPAAAERGTPAGLVAAAAGSRLSHPLTWRSQSMTRLQSLALATLMTAMAVGACGKKPDTTPTPAVTPDTTGAGAKRVADSIAAAQADSAAKARAMADSIARARAADSTAAAARAGDEVRSMLATMIHFEFNKAEIQGPIQATHRSEDRDLAEEPRAPDPDRRELRRARFAGVQPGPWQPPRQRRQAVPGDARHRRGPDRNGLQRRRAATRPRPHRRCVGQEPSR